MPKHRQKRKHTAEKSSQCLHEVVQETPSRAGILSISFIQFDILSNVPHFVLHHPFLPFLSPFRDFSFPSVPRVFVLMLTRKKKTCKRNVCVSFIVVLLSRRLLPVFSDLQVVCLP